MKDPYQTIGVSRTASAADIKKAYRKLAKELHPDRNPDNAKIADRFKEINAAYAIVGDEEARAKFDRGEIDAGGNDRGPFGGGFRQPPGGGPGAGGFNFNFGGGGGGPGGAGFDDIISEIFGGGARRRGGAQGAPKSADQQLKIEIGFVEAARGGTRRVSLPDGRSLDVRIPPGIEEGKQIRLKGQGPRGNAVEPGDVLIEVRVAAHPWFTRKGRDIHLDLPVSLKEAIQGARVNVPTLDGSVMLKVPKGAGSGTVLRLRGKGISPPEGEAGDQLVRLMIMLPKGQEAALDKFAEGLADDPGIRTKLGV